MLANYQEELANMIREVEFIWTILGTFSDADVSAGIDKYKRETGKK
jgi:hypothetical protein